MYKFLAFSIAFMLAMFVYATSALLNAPEHHHRMGDEVPARGPEALDDTVVELSPVIITNEVN